MHLHTEQLQMYYDFHDVIDNISRYFVCAIFIPFLKDYIFQILNR